ncbi:MAG TPA: type II and III secretion system protein family protein [Rhizomicrobium sp.]|nr:type II and III secretion system protein family protein [Rhizomicrobium sp.]
MNVRAIRVRAAVPTLASVFLALAIAGGAHAAQKPAPVEAEQADQAQSSEVVVGVGKSQVVDFAAPYHDLMVADPKIADIVPINSHSVYLVGKTIGSTSLSAYGAGKRLMRSMSVVVGADVKGLQARLHEILPNENNILVKPANQSIVLYGTASSPAALQQAVTLADTYDPGKVVNMMTVEGTQQVMLSVRLVEMDRSTAKNLRLNVNQTATNGSPVVAVNTGDSLVNNAQSILNSFGTMSLMWKVGGGDLTVLFDALETQGLVKTLAEPTLVTMSGETANFLAGGEFPIPVAQGSVGGAGATPAITIEFKQFGVSLAFTPTILSDGLVNMVVNPEVSSIDPTTSVTLGNITVPGIKVRRVHTTVELRDGESFTIAGLLQNNYQNDIRQYPFIGDLPIIGPLFRSTGFQQDQTELVVVVTPHLAVPRKAVAATPADQFVPPSDFELFLWGAQRGADKDLSPADRALMSVDPAKAGVDGPYGHVLY